MKLPIQKRRQEIADTIKHNQVTIVVGETGSGKTTEIPRILYEEGYSSNRKVIGVAQPRRVAAISIANHVSKRFETPIGRTCGYRVRFENELEKTTPIHFMTDGILLQELLSIRNADLGKYSVVVIDEAHERSLNIDFLLGFLKRILATRKDLKVVITSATIDADKFSSYFNGAPVVNIEGRTFPVDIRYDTRNPRTLKERRERVCSTVKSICRSNSKGDVLVFIDSSSEIDFLEKRLSRQLGKGVVVLPLYGALDSEDQARVFEEYPGKRKVILATNIAETSVTIDGVVYVVDTGFVKQTHFNEFTGTVSLDSVLHSQAGCNQRAGRAGRTQSGVCYRLFSQQSFENRPAFTEPEIRRSCLASVVLRLKHFLGGEDVRNFELLDQPEDEAYEQAFQMLRVLDAANGETLTVTGKKMVRLPLEPDVSRMLLESQKHGCVKQAITIAAFISGKDVFLRPKGKEEQARFVHRRLKNSRSDALTYLKVWNDFKSLKHNRRFEWCRSNFLNFQALLEIEKIRNQLEQSLRGVNFYVKSNADEDAILKAVAAGLINNLLVPQGTYTYKAAFLGIEDEVFSHPGSAMSGSSSLRVCAGMMRTTKLYASFLSEVKAEWLPEIAPGAFKLGFRSFEAIDEEANTVRVSRPLINLIDDSVVPFGRVEEIVTVEEAKCLQAETISEAEKAGLARVQFDPQDKTDDRGNIRFSARLGGEWYYPGFVGVPVRARGTYYGKVEPKHGRKPNLVIVQCRVLSELEDNPTDEGLASLAQAFNGVKTSLSES